MLSANNITLQYGKRVLFDEVNIKFNGDNIFEFKIPKIKKINPINNNKMFTLPLFNMGQIAITVNKIKKTIPKLLLEDLSLDI